MREENEYYEFFTHEDAVKEITDTVLDRIITKIALLLVFGFFVHFTITMTWNNVPFGRDDTDGVNRSGLIPYTDCKTGVQYLSTSGSAPTVRLDVSGKPMVDLTNCF